MSEFPKLTRVYRIDSVTVETPLFSPEGYFLDCPVVTCIGVFEYQNPDGSIRRELRLPEHVFDENSLQSYEGKPLIISHDAGRVDKSNVDDEIVGTILGPGFQDGDFVRAKVVIHNTDEVKRSGYRELSLGYDLDLIEEPGKWNGKPYDAIQTNILINHLALVGDARAGDQARLNLDSKNQTLKGAVKSMTVDHKHNLQPTPLNNKQRQDEAPADPEVTAKEDAAPPMDTAPVTAPDVVVEPPKTQTDAPVAPTTFEEALAVIAQLQEKIDAMQANADFASTAQPTAGDTETPCADEGEVASIGGGGTTLTIQMDSIDEIVRERLKLGRLGDLLNLDGLEEMKPMDAKKAVVRRVNPNMRLDGKSATYINAAFDAAVAQIGTDGGKDVNYQRRQMSSRMDGISAPSPSGKNGAHEARERMIERQMKIGGKK